MLLISRSMDLWNKNCISSLCLIDKLSFPSFFIFSFLFKLPISSCVSQIIKELCSSSSYSFHFCHLSFNAIVKKVISSQNMTCVCVCVSVSVYVWVFAGGYEMQAQQTTSVCGEIINLICPCCTTTLNQYRHLPPGIHPPVPLYWQQLPYTWTYRVPVKQTLSAASFTLQYN